MQSLSFTTRAKASPFPPDDAFSAKWAALVQRSRRKLQLFKKKSDHVDLVREFEALIAERRAADDLPYAALVAMSLGRYLESCADSYAAGVFVEASELFWEAAHQDADHGCTDPPEVLRLHARDAHAKATQGLESNKWIQSDVMLRAALHLCALEEWDEAGYLAEKSAEIERGLECMFDSHVGLCVAAKCYALSRNFAQVERVVKQMEHLAKQAATQDGAWPGFVKGTIASGWQTSWSESAVWHASLASLLLCVVTGRNEQMNRWEMTVRELLLERDGKLTAVWDALEHVVKTKRAEVEPDEAELDRCVKTIALVVQEEFVMVMFEEAKRMLLLKPNYDWEEKE